MTARTTMTTLITQLRGMTEAGTADYTVAGSSYWTDDQLQLELDRQRQIVVQYQLSPDVRYSTGGTIEYKIYRSNMPYWELSPVIAPSTNIPAGTADYSFDSNTGDVTFTADQAGTAYYITGAVYNLPRAAASIWRQKAAHYALAYDVSTGNHSLSRSQMSKHAREQAVLYDSMGGLGVGIMERSDNVNNWY